MIYSQNKDLPKFTKDWSTQGHKTKETNFQLCCTKMSRMKKITHNCYLLFKPHKVYYKSYEIKSVSH